MRKVTEASPKRRRSPQICAWLGVVRLRSIGWWLPPAHTMMTDPIRYSLSADCPEEDLQMKIPLRLQPVLIAPTLLNLGILGVAIAREKAVAAPSLTSDGILRGRGRRRARSRCGRRAPAPAWLPRSRAFPCATAAQRWRL